MTKKYPASFSSIVPLSKDELICVYGGETEKDADINSYLKFHLTVIGVFVVMRCVICMEGGF